MKNALFCAAAMTALFSAPAAEKVAQDFPGYSFGAVKLVCAEPGPWTFRTARAVAADGVETMTVTLDAPQDAAPPKFAVSFTLPQKDMPFFWRPGSPLCTFSGDWSAAASSNIAAWAPVYALLNADDRNRFTFACSECARVVNVKCGIHEADCTFAWKADFFSAPEAPLRHYEVKLRFDRRNVFWGDAVTAGVEWIFAARGEKPCPAPEAAYDPLYSTWYAFHHGVTDANVGEELKLAAKLGMKTVILDDGWQCDNNRIGYGFCGDWKASRQHFPDMAAHVAKAHALGLKYMVWYSMPFMGRRAENHARFKGKFLNREPVIGADILDPRFPEVRAFLAETYLRALENWNLDGFKLDFIGQFRFHGKDPAIAENYAGRDVKCLTEAVDILLKDILAKLTARRPDLLVEFRQPYMGPAIRKYGNMIRVGDCPGSFLSNRAGIASLRLTSPGSAVHSDMLEWHPDETPESAARAILNCLFGVIQYSVVLGRLPESHHRMTAHWLRFSQTYRGALLKGRFRPHHPEALYPVLEGEDDAARVLAVYTAGTVADCGAPDRETCVVNATGRKGLVLRLRARPKSVEAFDTFGASVPVAAPAAPGVWEIAVPESGYVRFTWADGPRELPVAAPPYLFHMSNRCGDTGKTTGHLPEMPNDLYFAREYVQTLYPESFMDLTRPVDFTVNGRRAWNVHPADKISKDAVTERRKMTFRLAAPGYGEKSVTVPLLMTSVAKTAGEPVRLMMIGASTVASRWGDEHNAYQDGGWGLVSAVQEYAVKDAVDAGVPCRFQTIGTETRARANAPCAVDYRGAKRPLRHFSEARSGTGLYYFTMTPVSVQPRALTTDIGKKNVHALQGAAIWDALGLGSRQPIGAPRKADAPAGPCPTDARGHLTAEACRTIRATPFGKYHWDYTERLWNNVANILKRTDRWTAAAEQKRTIDAFFEARMERPCSPFYDRAVARDGVWAFSIAKYLERCRTLTDDGERLYFGPHRETTGTGGGFGYRADGTKTPFRIGTWVTDTMQWDVCLPTHVAFEYGANDWCFYVGDFKDFAAEMASEHQQTVRRLLAAFQKAAPQVRIGLFASRTAGPAFPERWNDVAVAGFGRPHRDCIEPYRGRMRGWFKREFANPDAPVSYIPVDAVVPVVSSWSAAALEAPALGREVNVLYGQDLVHDGLRSQRCKALQIYAWSRYASRRAQ